MRRRNQLTFILCVVQGILSIIQIKNQITFITPLVQRELKDGYRNPDGICVDENVPITDGLHLFFFFLNIFFKHAALDEATHLVWIQVRQAQKSYSN